MAHPAKKAFRPALRSWATGLHCWKQFPDASRTGPYFLQVAQRQCGVGVAISPQGCSENAYCPLDGKKLAKLEDSEDPKDRHVDFNIFNRKPSETNSTQGRRHQGAMPHLGAITLWLDQEIPTRQVAKSLQNHLDLWENLLKTVLTAMFGHKSCLLHPLHCSDCTPLMITLSRNIQEEDFRRGPSPALYRADTEQKFSSSSTNYCHFKSTCPALIDEIHGNTFYCGTTTVAELFLAPGAFARSWILPHLERNQ